MKATFADPIAPCGSVALPERQCWWLQLVVVNFLRPTQDRKGSQERHVVTTRWDQSNAEGPPEDFDSQSLLRMVRSTYRQFVPM